MTKYLIRLDDACPTMNLSKWEQIEQLLDKYNIKPMVGIIPNNADPSLIKNDIDPHFWDKAQKWQDKGWAIALHGFDHCYKTSQAGINPTWSRSEFAGVSLEEQKQKITQGIKILQQYKLIPHYFFAPSHTYDDNTLKALKECSNIRIICDTIATMPYKENEFIFIPQIFGHCRYIPIAGIYTFCFHPNNMKYSEIYALERFIRSHHMQFSGFNELCFDNIGDKSLFDKLISWLYFKQRKLRGLK